MTDEYFAGYMQKVNENFSDLDDAIIEALPGKDEHYAGLKAREQELKERFPGIEGWLENGGPLSLTAEEHAGMVEYLNLSAEMEGIERLEIYFEGHKDCFAYLKKIGAV